jgi:hypothetical protein
LNTSTPSLIFRNAQRNGGDRAGRVKNDEKICSDKSEYHTVSSLAVALGVAVGRESGVAALPREIETTKRHQEIESHKREPGTTVN